MSKVTKEEIIKIAKLAKLKFTDDELAKFEKEFNSILGYITIIQECDVEGIEFEHNLNDYTGTVLREDKVKKSLSQEKALQNASNGRNRNGYIKTSKIVSKE